VLAGQQRVRSLRRLAWRVDVPGLSIFVSALVQADQVGAGVSEVLRRQAEDQRSRRREQALTQAGAIPVKLLFPLVVCFLPAIMVFSLGPMFYQLFQFIEGFLRARGL
jgi:tight adherence protein C